MAETIGGASWDTIEALRDRLGRSLPTEPTLAAASQAFVQELVATFPTIMLARVFVVTRMSTLPPPERDIATDTARTLELDDALAESAPILALLGSAGQESSWNSRETSYGHRAVPLAGALVESTPMIAALLSSLDVDLGAFRADPGVQIRAMTGNLNKRFFVPDARTATDAQGRHVIAAQDFVARYGIRTVFGMGGGFVNGMLTVVMLFTSELLEAGEVDRLASFIGTFKMATSTLAQQGAIFPA